MGHTVNLDRHYRLLQRQLDRTVTGAPPSRRLAQILRLLYPPRDVELACRLPLHLTVLDDLAARLKTPVEPLLDQLTGMAHRGLIFDVQQDGRRYFCLAPLVLGFFEFTFMRTREDLPLGELARLFDEYLREDWRDGTSRSFFRGSTQFGRVLIDEKTLPEDETEVLDWQRASHVVQTATALGVGLCACRHKANHLGRACDGPQRVCLSLNYAADSLIRNGFCEPITTAEGMRILEISKNSGLVQIAENVRRRVSYLCNCCGCCCEMFRAAKVGEIHNAITTSAWIMQVDPQQCNGCGRCAAACPITAIDVGPALSGLAGDGPNFRADENGTVPFDGTADQARTARLREDLCLGCGVCCGVCRRDAISMQPRAKRVFTPETIIDRMALMAVERNKLADFIFDRRGPVSHRVLVRLVAILQKTPLLKAAVAIKPLRSAFLRAAIATGRRHVGRLIGEP
ncbi:MAG: 4Fe-4S binding protein [Thermoguttaceae bacterium]